MDFLVNSKRRYWSTPTYGPWNYVTSGFSAYRPQYSSDGDVWTASALNETFPDNLRQVAGNNTTVIGATDTGRVMRSTDMGANWECVPCNFIFYGVEAVAFGDGKFVIGGSNNDHYSYIAISEDDGMTWSYEMTPTLAAVRYLKYSAVDNIWVSASDWNYGVRVSTDLSTWTVKVATGDYFQIARNDSTWMAIGSACKISTDGGATWSSGTLPATSCRNVYGYDNYFVSWSGTPNGIYRTTNNGASWTLVQSTGAIAAPYGYGYKNNLLFIYNFGGYWSNNGGLSFSPITTGIQTVGPGVVGGNNGGLASQTYVAPAAATGFATLDPLFRSAGIGLTNGNLTATRLNAITEMWSLLGWHKAYSNMPLPDRGYFECTSDIPANATGFQVGLDTRDAVRPRHSQHHVGEDNPSMSFAGDNGATPYTYQNGGFTYQVGYPDVGPDDSIHYAWDITAGKAWVRVHVNSTGITHPWVGGGDPATGTSPTWTFTPGTIFYAALAMYAGYHNNHSMTMNFGATAFVGTVPAGFPAGVFV